MDQQINKRIEGLRKNISTLEWDLPHIKNDNLRSYKEGILRNYKKELEELLKNQSKASWLILMEANKMETKKQKSKELKKAKKEAAIAAKYNQN